MDAKRVAVLGASGGFGGVAARAFRDAGWRVRAITRTGKGPIAGVEYATADALRDKELIAATADCEVIVNGLNPPYPQWRELVQALARNVMAAAEANGALHLFPGNVYNFGTTIPPRPTEATPFAPDHEKAQIRVAAEKLFAERAQAGRARTAVIRAGDFFGGQGAGSWFPIAIASKLAKGKFVYPGSLDIEHAWAYLPDLARAFVAVAERGAKLPAFDTFHFGGHNVTGRQMLAACEIATGAKLKTGGVPWPLLRLAGLFSPLMREVSAMAYLWRRPHALTGTKLEAFAGPLAQTPFDEAVRQALADLGIGQARAAA